MLSIRHSAAVGMLVAALPFACMGQSPMPTMPSFGTDGAARVLELTGQVSVLKDSGPWALQPGNLVQVRQIIVTGPDGFAVFQVADGSSFEVYPNSRITFRANPSNWRDLLDVWLGRVKVHIEKMTGGPNHNRVRTPTAVISVRGTTFDVAVETEDSTLISVEEGQVAVQHALLPNKEPRILSDGEYLRIYKDQPLAQSSPRRDAAIRHGLNAAAEALYRIIYRSPTPGAGGGRLPTPAGGGTGTPVPGDTEGSAPPPPPPNNE